MELGHPADAAPPLIERSRPTRAAWQQELADSIRQPDLLCDLLGLAETLRPAARRAAADFPLLVPRSFLQRIRPRDPADPLLRQVLPLADELHVHPDFVVDPVGDDEACQTPGLLQKYAGRALMITSGACAIHCRYCFRRHYPYEQAPRRIEDWAPALEHLRRDESLHEALLSGGDPLTLTDERLSLLITELESIPHLRRLRLHTRLPIVIPSRVTAELLDRLTSSPLTPIVVLHANHAAELQSDCADAVKRLVRSGITTLNQAVLLRGVNDHEETLVELCERLVDLGVIPYYLHQLDRVQGAAHFEVPVEEGLRLVAALTRRLPGYAVPRYVQEVAGDQHKRPITAWPEA